MSRELDVEEVRCGLEAVRLRGTGVGGGGSGELEKGKKQFFFCHNF